jgi:hypothetical protein
MKLSFKNLFYLNEFRESPILPLFALYFFITSVASFMGWIYGDPSTLFCSPHISQCDWWKQLLLFHGFPESYARSAFYSLLLGVVFS